MNEQKIIISSLVMDLKRVALGLHRGSFKMADRFKVEALSRQEELEKLEIPEYLKVLIKKSKKSLLESNDRSAEDALMYSTLFQNFVLRKMN